MLTRFLAVLIVLGFLIPSIAGAEFAPQFKKSSKGKADLSKSAPVHGKIYKSNSAMEKTSAQKQIGKHKQVMERNAAQEQQGHKLLQGTMNE
jgi:hypothetical protein